jgi:hypothetical protein
VGSHSLDRLTLLILFFSHRPGCPSLLQKLTSKLPNAREGIKPSVSSKCSHSLANRMLRKCFLQASKGSHSYRSELSCSPRRLNNTGLNAALPFTSPSGILVNSLGTEKNPISFQEKQRTHTQGHKAGILCWTGMAMLLCPDGWAVPGPSMLCRTG